MKVLDSVAQDIELDLDNDDEQSAGDRAVKYLAGGHIFTENRFAQSSVVHSKQSLGEVFADSERFFDELMNMIAGTITADQFKDACHEIALPYGIDVACVMAKYIQNQRSEV